MKTHTYLQSVRNEFFLLTLDIFQYIGSFGAHLKIFMMEYVIITIIIHTTINTSKITTNDNKNTTNNNGNIINPISIHFIQVRQ